ncbi:MAG: helix-turn-helix transcriptional regulator [Clostridia bacterium]|nr:helix-turn-helix transcriptional regulator [Clostridia bacterium]
MNQIKINEQIAVLRKQKGLTQEELASMLGVTNQAVSKWESAQCCPDIQLLPLIADCFEVSIDELMGHDAVVQKTKQ